MPQMPQLMMNSGIILTNILGILTSHNPSWESLWTNQYSGMTEEFLNTAQIVQIPKFLGDILDLDRVIESVLYACCWNHTFLSATVVD